MSRRRSKIAFAKYKNGNELSAYEKKAVMRLRRKKKRSQFGLMEVMNADASRAISRFSSKMASAIKPIEGFCRSVDKVVKTLAES